jgi:hypothetical protein
MRLPNIKQSTYRLSAQNIGLTCVNVAMLLRQLGAKRSERPKSAMAGPGHRRWKAPEFFAWQEKQPDRTEGPRSEYALVFCFYAYSLTRPFRSSSEPDSTTFENALKRKTAAWDDDFLASLVATKIPHPIPLPLEHFQAKQPPVRVRKMRKNKNLEPRFDSIKSGLQARPRALIDFLASPVKRGKKIRSDIIVK